MKEKFYNDIKCTDLYGVLYPDEVKRFNDSNYFSKENLFQYRLSKIKFFIGEKNGKELILGLQTFYSQSNGNIIANEEARDKLEKELDIKIFEIPPNDYICNFFLKTGDERITQIKLQTKKGKIFVVGSNEGEDKTIDFKDNNDNVIIYFLGGYRKCLEVLAAGYIPLKSYIGRFIGYFELKIRLKNETFKNVIKKKLNSLSERDKILFRVCNLPDTCFYSIIKFCLF